MPSNPDAREAVYPILPDSGSCFELLCVIVNFGVSSRVHQIARSCGIAGQTVFLGKGTASNKILVWLEWAEVRKEIIWMVASRDRVNQTMLKLRQSLQLDKPNHGIAFSVPIASVVGSRTCPPIDIKKRENEDKRMFGMITVIVDKGQGELVVEAAKSAGARGGTIINARGSGIHETSRLFAMEIEPEKEIVLILAEQNVSGAITEAVRQKLELDQPGKGILFVTDVSQVYGVR